MADQPDSREDRGLRAPVSILLLAVSMLLTAVGAMAILVAPRLSRGTRLTMAVLLAATAGGVIPLAMTGLFSSNSARYGLLLVLAVIGMEALTLHIPRATSSRPL